MLDEKSLTDKKQDTNGVLSDVTDPKQLTTVYKKNGSFDLQRRLLLENFKQSETHSNLQLKLKLMVEGMVKQDPSILMKNRGKMGALIQGNIINQHMQNKNESSVLSIVDKDFQDKITGNPEFQSKLKDELKDIKRRLLGISDEEYEKELEQERAKQLLEEKQKEEKKHSRSDRDYRNNFKLKQLSSNKITKPPKFNFSSRGSWYNGSNETSSGSEVSANGNTKNSSNNYTTNAGNSHDDKNPEDSSSKRDIPFLTY
ncbi:uncharacterized protein PRCAT00001998001 [Priceomyces carsonii]|uniref:uncharacterized protein n=1 Tax=Priceomyces carsonii TaxID=28549 RepID=UPI002EDB7CE5|nr:unnamed protein product [Priceomyces carsonii]